MSDPGSPADLNERFGAVWKHLRHLESRITTLETGRARTDAISSWLRARIPLALSAAGLLLATVDLILKYGGPH